MILKIIIWTIAAIVIFFVASLACMWLDVHAAEYNSYRPEKVSRETSKAYRPDGTVLGRSPSLMESKPIVVDSVMFGADSLATVKLNAVPSNTRRRTTPTATELLTVEGPFTITEYNSETGVVTLRALYEFETYTTVSLRVQ